jgi:hypothetical protein
MKLHLDKFTANNPSLTIYDVILDVSMGVTNEGVININLKSEAKYLVVEADGSFHGADYSGLLFTIRPIIDGLGYDRVNMSDDEFDKYFNHDDYYAITFVLETDNRRFDYSSVATALRHEYFISFVPDDLVMNYKCLSPATLTIWED